MSELRDSYNLLKLVKELSSWIKGDKSDALRLECMNGLGVYTTTINVQSKFSKWINKIDSCLKELPRNLVYDAKMHAIKPYPERIEGAIHHMKDKVVVDLSKGLKYDMFRLEVSYRMDEEWLSSLVHKRSSTEPLKDAMKYNLSAQLIDPPSLAKGFKRVDIDEFPISARVHIRENISTALPLMKTYLRMVEIEKEILSDYDPRHATKVIGLQQERHRLKKRIEREDPQRTLSELMVFLRPTKFQQYLRTEEDFRLHKCEWGELFEKLGAIAFPKAMEVITRTDLTLNNPASKGVLVYESGKFIKDIGSLMKKKRPPSKLKKQEI